MNTLHASTAVAQRNEIDRGVTVTRVQFNLLRLAALQYASECRSHAREASHCGQDDIAASWVKDADQFRALYLETEGK